jgi:hypothetical protein
MRILRHMRELQDGKTGGGINVSPENSSFQIGIQGIWFFMR